MVILVFSPEPGSAVVSFLRFLGLMGKVIEQNPVQTCGLVAIGTECKVLLTTQKSVLQLCGPQ